MIRYFKPVRPQTTKGKAVGWLYAQANDESGMPDRYWTQLSYEEVGILLSNGWKFYYDHDRYLYDLERERNERWSTSWAVGNGEARNYFGPLQPGQVADVYSAIIDQSGYGPAQTGDSHMKITVVKGKLTPLENVQPGETFCYEGFYHINMGRNKALRLVPSGCPATWTFIKDTMVEVVDAELKVTHR